MSRREDSSRVRTRAKNIVVSHGASDAAANDPVDPLSDRPSAGVLVRRSDGSVDIVPTNRPSAMREALAADAARRDARRLRAAAQRQVRATRRWRSAIALLLVVAGFIAIVMALTVPLAPWAWPAAGGGLVLVAAALGWLPR